ncbi:MAG: hypothetical protein KDG50_01600 [Chromatiales bacterium]|nr:hypothetical protein [Chromatiales bacterium]
MAAAPDEALCNLLYLIVRRRLPGTGFDGDVLASVLAANRITSLRQLFALGEDEQARICEQVRAANARAPRRPPLHALTA